MFKSLYAKISAIFLALILVMGGVQIFLSINSSVNYVCEATQKLNVNLAAQIASRCEPFFQDSIHHGRLMKTVADFHELNPHANIFILNEQGDILASSLKKERLQRKRIDIKPIRRFLAGNSYEQLPILGEDPTNRNEKKIFSATPISMGKMGNGFLYVTLASSRSDLGSKNILNSYILRSASVSILITMLFAAAVGLVLFFLLTKRIQTLTNALRQFTAGEFNRRIPVPGSDELSEMANAFNFMAETIEKNVRQLQKNDLQRRELVANISHDLRSPLASIQGYLETILMKQQELPPERQKEFLEITLRNVIHLSRLVNQLFELSKLDGNEIRLHAEPFSLSELLQDIVLKFKPLSDEKHISLESDIPEGIPLVFGDIGMIERVISNLIENAIKYSPSHGHIFISLQKEGRTVRFMIKDQGPGISETDLPHIFDRFYMADKSRTKGKHGSGLGLAIAQRILKKHNSRLTVKSKTGEGTQFSFSLVINPSV